MPEHTGVGECTQAAETPPCAWCGEPSVGEITVEPDRFTSRRVEHPITRERMTLKQLTRNAIRVAVCERHAGILDGQPLVLTQVHGRTPNPEQLDLFDLPAPGSTPNAIYGEAA
jgi:hypothetical protein